MKRADVSYVRPFYMNRSHSCSSRTRERSLLFSLLRFLFVKQHCTLFVTCRVHQHALCTCTLTNAHVCACFVFYVVLSRVSNALLVCIILSHMCTDISFSLTRICMYACARMCRHVPCCERGGAATHRHIEDVLAGNSAVRTVHRPL